MSRFLMVQCV